MWVGIIPVNLLHKKINTNSDREGLIIPNTKSLLPLFHCQLQDNNYIQHSYYKDNKANLRDLITATGLVILLKLDSNRRFFSREMPNLGQNGRLF